MTESPANSKVPFIGGESLLCHECRHDEEQYPLAEFFDELCPLEINEKRTCARCHEQRGVWWFIDLAPPEKGSSGRGTD